jgi:AcrR family transcriptional regulator
MPRAPQTKGERTRADIVDAAYTLFIANGFNGTSIRQIAQKADIALSGLYFYFASKEDIFGAVFLERHPFLEILPMLEAAQGDDIEAILRNVAQRMIDLLTERPDFLNLMFIEMIELKGSHIPFLVEHAFPRLQRFVMHINETWGQDQLRPLPIPIILRAFVGLFISYAITDKMLVSDRLPAEFRADSLNYFVDIFLHGILQPTRPLARPSRRLPERISRDGDKPSKVKAKRTREKRT